MAEQSKYQRYEENQRGRGLVKVHMWVPAEDKQRALNYGGRLRKSFAKKQKGVK